LGDPKLRAVAPQSPLTNSAIETPSADVGAGAHINFRQRGGVQPDQEQVAKRVKGGGDIADRRGQARQVAVAPGDSAIKAVAGCQKICFAGEKVGWVGRIEGDTFLRIIARAFGNIEVWADVVPGLEFDEVVR